jgi:hypothetical protein
MARIRISPAPEFAHLRYRPLNLPDIRVLNSLFCRYFEKNSPNVYPPSNILQRHIASACARPRFRPHLRRLMPDEEFLFALSFQNNSKSAKNPIAAPKITSE